HARKFGTDDLNDVIPVWVRIRKSFELLGLWRGYSRAHGRYRNSISLLKNRQPVQGQLQNQQSERRGEMWTVARIIPETSRLPSVGSRSARFGCVEAVKFVPHSLIPRQPHSW